MLGSEVWLSHIVEGLKTNKLFEEGGKREFAASRQETLEAAKADHLSMVFLVRPALGQLFREAEVRCDCEDISLSDPMQTFNVVRFGLCIF
ncbi:MAG: hypothetical protein R8G34_00060 [Paracoccaceae bacterium]|nr:hypothetical protein [Paracoccaceae bacterium]